VRNIARRLGLIYNDTKDPDKVYLGLPDSLPELSDKLAPPNVQETGDNVLRFVLRLPKQPASRIIDGVIMLGGQQYKATSGATGSQVFGSYWVTARSPIPPGASYKVDLRWNYSDLPGINGRFYHILPDPIVNPDGSGQRSEIGLHQDNGTPGTAGCIGVVGSDWSKLCNALDERAKFCRYLPLEVSYICQD
jgi:hypothetical protein